MLGLAQEANSLALRSKPGRNKDVCCSCLANVLSLGPFIVVSLCSPRRVYSFLRRGFFASAVLDLRKP